MKRWALLVGAVLVVVSAWAVVPSGASVTRIGRSVQHATSEAPLLATVFKKFSSNSFGGTTVVISKDGNVIGFASPKDLEHIAFGEVSEGYVLCYDDPHTQTLVNTYDTADKASGFGASTDSTGPVKVVRTTSDGDLRLTQTFSFNGLGRYLRITMALTNLSGLPISEVSLRRQVDFDVDAGGKDGTGNPDNLFGASSSSVFAYNDSGGGLGEIGGHGDHGMMLRLLADNGFRLVSGAATHIPNDSSCNPNSDVDTTPIGPVDDGATFNTLGFGATLPAGKTFSQTIEYDAF
jgi:hypothetical protein